MKVWHSPRVDPDAATYAARWTAGLARGEPTEPWHLDVIQAQFIDAEANALRNDFIAAHTGLTTSGVAREQRVRVVLAAVRLLNRFGRSPRVDVFWLPEAARNAVAA